MKLTNNCLTKEISADSDENYKMKQNENILYDKKRYLIILSLLIFILSVHVLAQPKYENPIIPGFNPDPSICRVEENYYLVTSTFEYFPGVPVYHSRDLVNWKIIGYALHRPSQLNLDSIACSGGIYAQTIRYYKGLFYMITTLVGQKNAPQHRNFIVTAKNPAGPWSEPHWIEDAPGIDPSLFFDDNGKVYYSGNGTPEVRLWDKHRNIWIQELDIKTWKLVGKKVDILDGGEYYKKGTLDGGIESGVNNYEASHIYKKDGKYYLIIAHGGTSQNHAVSIWMSENIFGPYIMNHDNPILTHRDLSRENYFTSTGHADLVQTQKGEWWMVYLAKRPYGGENHILGRETFMSPVDWSGTWPVVNPKGLKGRGELKHQSPNLQSQKVSDISYRDEFKSNTLNKYWTFIRTPRAEWWSLNKRKGFLRIDLRPEKISDQANPSFIGKRQEHKSFSATVRIEFKPLSENEESGLVVERDKDYYFKFTLGFSRKKPVLFLSQKNGITTKDSIIAKSDVDNKLLLLQISSEGYLYSFKYSYDGKDWNTLRSDVDGRILGIAGAGRFTGTFIGVYASSNGAVSKNYSDFDWFDYRGLDNSLNLPSFISDGMVLQRDIHIPIWGWASPGEKVVISFNSNIYTTVTGVDGKWKLKIKPTKAGGPYEMAINGNKSIIIKDILVGDVWLCSGQSNMEFEMFKVREKYAEEIASSNNNFIRQFKVKRRISFNPNNDVGTEEGWQHATPNSILNFTAVGYFFAKYLYDKYKVPIGLINCSYGGTPAEAWMHEDALKDFPNYYSKAMEYKDTAKVNSIISRDKQFTKNWYSQVNKSDSGIIQKWFSTNNQISGWKSMLVPNFWKDQGLKYVEGGVVWFRKEVDIPSSLEGKNAILWLGNICMNDSTYFNGNFIGSTTSKYTPRKYYIDGSIIKKGKNIITVRILNEYGDGGFIKDKPYKMEIGGTIIDLANEWEYKLSVNTQPLQRDDVTRFQGQATSMYYGMLSPLIGYGIKGATWYQGESNISRSKEYRNLFPALINSWRKEWNQGNFPFLFVQLANNNASKILPGESKLAELQEAQSSTLLLPNTGMAVTNDIGEWNDVHPLNKSEVGRRLFLSAQKVAYDDKNVVFSGPQYQSMKIENNKIILTFSNIGSGLVVKGEGELKYFSIADESKKFVWAQAKIVDNKVVVWADSISNPIAVRYAWADNPVGANLYNKEGLPASCFRTDK